MHHARVMHDVYLMQFNMQNSWGTVSLNQRGTATLACVTMKSSFPTPLDALPWKYVRLLPTPKLLAHAIPRSTVVGSCRINHSSIPRPSVLFPRAFLGGDSVLCESNLVVCLASAGALLCYPGDLLFLGSLLVFDPACSRLVYAVDFHLGI